MSYRAAALALVFGLVAVLLWRHELFTVQRPGDAPRDLVAKAAPQRHDAFVDAVLPAVPIGMRRLRAGDEVMLIHYWAPWQDEAFSQALALDSLRRSPGLETLRIEVVCFDPFPSVARYIARHRLALPVLLDLRSELRSGLPCPSLPFTYVVDAAGGIAIAQPGRVDWLSAGTRRTLTQLLKEQAPKEQDEPQRQSPARGGNTRSHAGGFVAHRKPVLAPGHDDAARHQVHRRNGDRQAVDARRPSLEVAVRHDDE